MQEGPQSAQKVVRTQSRILSYRSGFKGPLFPVRRGIERRGNLRQVLRPVQGLRLRRNGRCRRRDAAIKSLDGSELKGRNIKVNEARSRERGGGGGRGGDRDRGGGGRGNRW